MNFNLCACMGPIGDDLYCPCTMKSKGLEPTNLWTPDKIAELGKFMSDIFNSRNQDRTE